MGATKVARPAVGLHEAQAVAAHPHKAGVLLHGSALLCAQVLRASRSRAARWGIAWLLLCLRAAQDATLGGGGGGGQQNATAAAVLPSYTLCALSCALYKPRRPSVSPRARQQFSERRTRGLQAVRCPINMLRRLSEQLQQLRSPDRAPSADTATSPPLLPTPCHAFTQPLHFHPSKCAGHIPLTGTAPPTSWP